MTPSSCARRTELRQCRKNTIMNRSAAEQDLTQRAQRTQRSERTRRGITMRVTAKFGAILVASVLAAAGAARAQEMQMPKQEEHQHIEIPPVKPEYPRMGRAQEHAQGALIPLERRQTIASESKPTLRQAEA